MYNLPRYWKNETVLLYNILTTVAYKQKYITQELRRFSFRQGWFHLTSNNFSQEYIYS